MSAVSARRELVSSIGSALGTRNLIWFGTRGDDVDAIADLPNLTHSFSIIGRYETRASVDGTALEDLDHQRVDLDQYDIDTDLGLEAVQELRRRILRATSSPSALFTYRPSTFLSSISFARVGRTEYLGLFKDFQAAFEHKPWVESSVAGLDIPRVAWTYVADEDQLDAIRLFDQGPVVLRPSRTSGGVGITRVEQDRQLAASWLRGSEAFVSIAPFVDGSIPLNIGAVVWDDGITLHHPSFQLIGVPSLTGRTFGYCGNDFGAVKELSRSSMDAIERSTLAVGEWLRGRSYRGAFGIDFLLKDDQPLFLEVNPRFQGSTHLSCQIAKMADEPCLMLDHLAAMLGLPCPKRQPLTVMARSAPDLSHVIMHYTGSSPDKVDSVTWAEPLIGLPSFDHLDVLARDSHVVHPSAIVARVTLKQRVTRAGFDSDYLPEIANRAGNQKREVTIS